LTKRVTPHFGVVQAWNGELDSPGPSTPTQIAADTWDMGDDTLVAAATIPTEGTCRGALWAAPAGSRAAPIAHELASDELVARALEALSALPASRAIQRDYLQYENAEGSWLETEERHVTVWRVGGTTPELVVVSVRA